MQDKPKQRLINAYDLEKYTVVRDGHKYVPRVAISEVETADTVVHAEWVDSKNIFGLPVCSNCMESQPGRKTRYCQNCGAKMDGG